MNPPVSSKINWTALAIAVIGLLIATDALPPEVEKPVTDITMILLPALIVVFRTWFTDKTKKESPLK